MSLSTAINEKSAGHRALIAACHSDRILAESDFHDASECAARTWRMIVIIAEVKNWRVEDTWESEDDYESLGVVKRLARNWEAFQKRQTETTSTLRVNSELELETDEEEH
jgi:Tat protein secretion system quality control protein TatD with DNase activity